MATTRRSILAAGAGIAAMEIAGTASTPAFAQSKTDIDRNVANIIKLSADSNSALMRGDIKAYLEIVTHSEDFLLMSPFGGEPTHGFDRTPERLETLGRFFKDGTLEQELVQAYGTADMVVLAIIEHNHVAIGRIPIQSWPLRVTLVYRREADGWQLVHRHADPLVKGVSHETAAALARGDIS